MVLKEAKTSFILHILTKLPSVRLCRLILENEIDGNRDEKRLFLT